MQLFLIIKGNKYIVEDKKSRLLYTVKKKGFGNSKFILLDASNYNLYTLMNTTDLNEKPSFSIILNDSTFMKVACKSRFFEPTVLCQSKEISYNLVTKNSRDFSIMDGDTEKGIIETNVSASGELQYDITIDDKIFDDYIPLFAVIIDKIFGDANRQPKVIEQIMKDKKEKNKKKENN